VLTEGLDEFEDFDVGKLIESVTPQPEPEPEPEVIEEDEEDDDDEESEITMLAEDFGDDDAPLTSFILGE